MAQCKLQVEHRPSVGDLAMKVVAGREDGEPKTAGHLVNDNDEQAKLMFPTFIASSM